MIDSMDAQTPATVCTLTVAPDQLLRGDHVLRVTYPDGETFAPRDTVEEVYADWRSTPSYRRAPAGTVQVCYPSSYCNLSPSARVTVVRGATDPILLHGAALVALGATEVEGRELRDGDIIRHYCSGSVMVAARVRVLEGPHAPNGRRVHLTYRDGAVRTSWAMDWDRYERVHVPAEACTACDPCPVDAGEDVARVVHDVDTVDVGGGLARRVTVSYPDGPTCVACDGEPRPADGPDGVCSPCRAGEAGAVSAALVFAIMAAAAVLVLLVPFLVFAASVA